MTRDQRCAFANVKVTLIVPVGSWGPDCTLAQATRQAEDSAVSLVRNQFAKRPDIQVHAVEHVGVTYSEWTRRGEVVTPSRQVEPQASPEESLRRIAVRLGVDPNVLTPHTAIHEALDALFDKVADREGRVRDLVGELKAERAATHKAIMEVASNLGLDTNEVTLPFTEVNDAIAALQAELAKTKDESSLCPADIAEALGYDLADIANAPTVAEAAERAKEMAENEADAERNYKDEAKCARIWRDSIASFLRSVGVNPGPITIGLDKDESNSLGDALGRVAEELNTLRSTPRVIASELPGCKDADIVAVISEIRRLRDESTTAYREKTDKHNELVGLRRFVADKIGLKVYVSEDDFNRRLVTFVEHARAAAKAEQLFRETFIGLVGVGFSGNEALIAEVQRRLQAGVDAANKLAAEQAHRETLERRLADLVNTAPSLPLEAVMSIPAGAVVATTAAESDDLYEGARIYHRRADLFGIVKAIDGDAATVSYEPPHNGEPVSVPRKELMFAMDLEQG